MKRQTQDRDSAPPRPTNVAILHVGIMCCALTMAIVIAVALVAAG